MTDRENISAILNYKTPDRIPVLHFGFWRETLEKWVREGHLTEKEIVGIDHGNYTEKVIASKMGFDANYFSIVYDKIDSSNGLSGMPPWYGMPLNPAFEEKVIEDYGDGSSIYQDMDGVISLLKPGLVSIPREIGHTLKDRMSWEKEYVPRLKWTPERLNTDRIDELKQMSDSREDFIGLYCGSLYGKARNYWGIVEISYLQVDDPQLFTECIDMIADSFYECTRHVLETGVGTHLDYAHFWEDICFKGGPLIAPELFREKTGKHYRRNSDLCNKHGINIISVDCDGYIDDLVPIWLDNGVNTMFPIEVGGWNYSFETMRNKFGKECRGVGNMDKNVLHKDKRAVDDEIKRLRKLIDLGGFIPCPDHNLAPDTEWDLVRYYCDRMHEEFSKG